MSLFLGTPDQSFGPVRLNRAACIDPADQAQEGVEQAGEQSEPSSTQAGRVSTQASRMLHSVACCNLARLAYYGLGDAGRQAVGRADRRADRVGGADVSMATVSRRWNRRR
jgi:hypothetical protein